MNDNPIATSMNEFNERVAKPWAEAMGARFQALGNEFRQMQAVVRAQLCPCGCGHTLGEVMGDGILNPHMLFRLRTDVLLGDQQKQ